MVEIQDILGEVKMLIIGLSKEADWGEDGIKYVDSVKGIIKNGSVRSDYEKLKKIMELMSRKIGLKIISNNIAVKVATERYLIEQSIERVLEGYDRIYGGVKSEDSKYLLMGCYYIDLLINHIKEETGTEIGYRLKTLESEVKTNSEVIQLEIVHQTYIDDYIYNKGYQREYDINILEDIPLLLRPLDWIVLYTEEVVNKISDDRLRYVIEKEGIEVYNDEDLNIVRKALKKRYGGWDNPKERLLAYVGENYLEIKVSKYAKYIHLYNLDVDITKLNIGILDYIELSENCREMILSVVIKNNDGIKKTIEGYKKYILN